MKIILNKNFNFIYDFINLLNIICFAFIPFNYNNIPIEYHNSIQKYLISYFFIDSFKNYNNTTILLHHSMYSFLIYVINKFEFTCYYLVLDISTVFLLLIKTFKITSLKQIFIFLWILLRFIYFPLITYNTIIFYYNNLDNNLDNNIDNNIDNNSKIIILFLTSIISHNLHLYWSILFFDKNLYFKYSLSSNFLHIVPISCCIYYKCLTFEKYIISFYMFLFSSLQYVFKYSEYKKIHNLVLALDTTLITYISLMNIYNKNYIKFIVSAINYILKIKYKKSKIHMIFTLVSFVKHIFNDNYFIILTQPGCLIFIHNLLNNNYFNYEDLFLWHSSVSYAIANTFILK